MITTHESKQKVYCDEWIDFTRMIFFLHKHNIDFDADAENLLIYLL